MELELISYLPVELRWFEVYTSVPTMCCRGFPGLAPCVGASSVFGHTGFLPFRGKFLHRTVPPKPPFSFAWLSWVAWEGLSYGEAPVTGRKYPPVTVQQCQNWGSHKELHCHIDGSELHVLLLGDRRLELKTRKACQVLQIVLSLPLVQREKCFKNEL